MDTQKFIQHVASGNASEAKDILNDVLSARAFESLDVKKQDISKALYSNGEDIEVQDTADTPMEDELLTQEEAELDEATMTNITLGKKVKNDQGGYIQNVHHKGVKIGHIEAYKQRGEMRYGHHHDATGDGAAGSRTPEDSIADLRWDHAQHLSNKE